jgi:hypothetical protein
MDVRMATHSGHPERGNEDFVGAVPGAVVVIDGAGIPGAESLCRHGVAWYAHSLGAALLGRLSLSDDLSLTDALAAAIGQVADSHRHTCDLANPSNPQATVCAMRLEADRADYLLLADTTLLLGTADGGVTALTDEREVAVRRACTGPLDGLTPGSPKYDAALPGVRAALRERRNQPGGYWIAREDPAAAAEAVTGSVALDDLTDAVLLSNGVTRLVDPYALMTWAELLDLTRASGPSRVLRMLRGHEPDESDRDDATLAHITM